MLIRTDKQFRHQKNSQKEKKLVIGFMMNTRMLTIKLEKHLIQEEVKKQFLLFIKKLKSAVFGFLIIKLKNFIAVKRISIANGMKMQIYLLLIDKT